MCPNVAARAAIRSGASLARARQSGRAGHILVVDDSELTHSLVRDILARASFTTTHVVSEAAALEAIGWYRFDAVILDVLIPGVRAFQLAAALRESAACPALPMIFYSSAYGDGDTDERAALLYPAFTVAKNGDVGKLTRTVDDALALCG